MKEKDPVNETCSPPASVASVLSHDEQDGVRTKSLKISENVKELQVLMSETNEPTGGHESYPNVWLNQEVEQQRPPEIPVTVATPAPYTVTSPAAQVIAALSEMKKGGLVPNVTIGPNGQPMIQRPTSAKVCDLLQQRRALQQILQQQQQQQPNQLQDTQRQGSQQGSQHHHIISQLHAMLQQSQASVRGSVPEPVYSLPPLRHMPTTVRDLLEQRSAQPAKVEPVATPQVSQPCIADRSSDEPPALLEKPDEAVNLDVALSDEVLFNLLQDILAESEQQASGASPKPKQEVNDRTLEEMLREGQSMSAPVSSEQKPVTSPVLSPDNPAVVQQNHMFFPTNPAAVQLHEPSAPASPSVTSPGQASTNSDTAVGQSSPQVMRLSDVPMHDMNSTQTQNHFSSQSVDSSTSVVVSEKDIKERLSALQDLASDLVPTAVQPAEPSSSRTVSAAHSPQQPDEQVYAQYSPPLPDSTTEAHLVQTYISQQQQNDVNFTNPSGQILVQQLSSPSMNIQTAAPVLAQSLLQSTVVQKTFEGSTQPRSDDMIFVQRSPEAAAQTENDAQSFAQQKLSLSNHTDSEFPKPQLQPQMFQLQHHLPQQPQQQTFQLDNQLPVQQAVFVSQEADASPQAVLHQVGTMPPQSSVAQSTFSHPSSPLNNLAKQPEFSQPSTAKHQHPMQLLDGMSFRQGTMPDQSVSHGCMSNNVSSGAERCLPTDVSLSQPFALSNTQARIVMRTSSVEQQVIFQQMPVASSQVSSVPMSQAALTHVTQAVNQSQPSMLMHAQCLHGVSSQSEQPMSVGQSPQQLQPGMKIEIINRPTLAFPATRDVEMVMQTSAGMAVCPVADVHMLQQSSMKAEPQVVATGHHLILSDAEVTNLLNKIGSASNSLPVTKEVITAATPAACEMVTTSVLGECIAEPMVVDHAHSMTNTIIQGELLSLGDALTSIPRSLCVLKRLLLSTAIKIKSDIIL